MYASVVDLVNQLVDVVLWRRHSGALWFWWMLAGGAFGAWHDGEMAPLWALGALAVGPYVLLAALSPRGPRS